MQVRIAPSTSDNVVTYTVIIHVDNPDLKLKPGMTANVSIETSKAVNVLRIPVAALRFTPPEGLLATISFDRDILTQKKTLTSGILWPERDGVMMRPVQVEIGINDGKYVELVREIRSDSGRPGRAGRPEAAGTGRPEGSPRQVLSEGTELVINAQAGVKSGKTTQGGLFGAPRVGRGGGPR